MGARVEPSFDAVNTDEPSATSLADATAFKGKAAAGAGNGDHGKEPAPEQLNDPASNSSRPRGPDMPTWHGLLSLPVKDLS
jgi:hypothetical protein